MTKQMASSGTKTHEAKELYVSLSPQEEGSGLSKEAWWSAAIIGHRTKPTSAWTSGEFITREHTLPQTGPLPARTVVRALRSLTSLTAISVHVAKTLPPRSNHRLVFRSSLRFSCFPGRFVENVFGYDDGVTEKKEHGGFTLAQKSIWTVVISGDDWKFDRIWKCVK